MTALINEFVQYLFKFIVMLVCAFLGICAGKAWREKKDAQTASEKSSN